MPLVLTQEEMDSILEALPEDVKKTSPIFSEYSMKGDLPYRQYDFRHPDRMSRDSRKILEQIHDRFSRELGAFLNESLRVNVNTRLISIDQYTLSEFMQRVSNPTCLYVFRLLEPDRKAVFEFHPDLVFYFLDRILGGPGISKSENRELTTIEQKIMQQFVEKILVHFQSCWKNTAAFQTQFSHYFSNVNFLQFAESGESVISITFEMEIDEAKYIIGLAYPYFLIEKLIPVLERSRNEQKSQVLPQEKRIIQKNLEQTTIPVVVRLGETKISIKELMHLQNGDSVILDKRTRDDLELVIGKNTHYQGKAGLLNNRLAFKVTRQLKG